MGLPVGLALDEDDDEDDDVEEADDEADEDAEDDDELAVEVAVGVAVAVGLVVGSLVGSLVGSGSPPPPSGGVVGSPVGVPPPPPLPSQPGPVGSWNCSTKQLKLSFVVCPTTVAPSSAIIDTPAIIRPYSRPVAPRSGRPGECRRPRRSSRTVRPVSPIGPPVRARDRPPGPACPLLVVLLPTHHPMTRCAVAAILACRAGRGPTPRGRARIGRTADIAQPPERGTGSRCTTFSTDSSASRSGP